MLTDGIGIKTNYKVSTTLYNIQHRIKHTSVKEKVANNIFKIPSKRGVRQMPTTALHRKIVVSKVGTELYT